MVRPLTDQGVGNQSPFIRQTFELADVVGSEVLRISAYGLYRCIINGERVGSDLLTPGWICHDKRLSYQTYRVAPLLKAGKNVIDIWLADGWFRSQLHWKSEAIYNTWGSQLAAIAEVRAGEAADAPVVVKTDETWSSGTLPVLRSGIYFGEIYDARDEGAEATGGSALLDGFDPATLIAHEVTPVRELAPLPVKERWSLGAGAPFTILARTTAAMSLSR